MKLKPCQTMKLETCLTALITQTPNSKSKKRIIEKNPNQPSGKPINKRSLLKQFPWKIVSIPKEELMKREGRAVFKKITIL